MRLVAHDADVRREGNLASAAQAIAIDRSDDWHGKRLESRRQGLHPARHRERGIVGIKPLEVFQVAAGNEYSLTGARKNHGADLGAGLEPVQNTLQLPHRREAYRVLDGRAIDGDEAYGVALLVPDV